MDHLNSINQNASSLIGLNITKKERLLIERDVEINRGNQLMLKKLIDIDLKKSDLNKRNIEPVAFKVRKSQNKRKSLAAKLLVCLHPQLQMNKKSRLDELREIAQGNLILMKKLQEVKPSYDAKKIEDG